MNPELALNASIDVATADTNSNLQLLDPNCQKTGDLITLKYQEVDWIESPHATTAVNVNPFNVLVFSGNIKLDPPSDNWSRTIYNNNQRTESTGARWAERSNVVGRREVGRSTRDIANISMGGMGALAQFDQLHNQHSSGDELGVGSGAIADPDAVQDVADFEPSELFIVKSK